MILALFNNILCAVVILTFAASEYNTWSYNKRKASDQALQLDVAATSTHEQGTCAFFSIVGDNAVWLSSDGPTYVKISEQDYDPTLRLAPFTCYRPLVSDDIHPRVLLTNPNKYKVQVKLNLSPEMIDLHQRVESFSYKTRLTVCVIYVGFLTFWFMFTVASSCYGSRDTRKKTPLPAARHQEPSLPPTTTNHLQGGLQGGTPPAKWPEVT